MKIEKLKEFNPDIPQKAYEEAFTKLTEESITKSLVEINFEKHLPINFHHFGETY